MVKNRDSSIIKRKPEESGLTDFSFSLSDFIDSSDNSLNEAKKAIFETIVDSCSASISEALTIQAKHSAGFMTTRHCLNGFIGQDYQKTVNL